jgi:hypothetical protein
MSNYTPGPWEFDKSALTGRIDIRKNHANGDSRILGYVWSDQNGESNARLIASAPDLLSALHLLLDKLHAHAPELITNIHTENAIVKAEMAIAKAEGVK